MKERLLRVVKLLAYPAFYVFCLALFGYLTFPFGRLKDRVIAEFEKQGKPGQHLEIGKLGAYWFTGIEVSGVKIHLPPEEASHAGFPGGADFGAPAATAKESVLTIDEAHARVRILPLLLGRVRLDFWASVFGGEIKGSVPVGSAKGEVEVQIDHVDISKIEPLAEATGIPLRGTATGKLVLEAPEGKFNKANGSFDLTIADVVVSDGKTKIQGLIELPPAKLGDLVLSAEAKDGTLKITKLTANGSDLEIVGDGRVTLREPWTEAVADLFLRFKFTDAYRGKNGTTKSLLGEPGSALPGLIEIQVPKMKRAKRQDGFYGWHIYGALKKLKFDPSTADFNAGPTPAVPSPARRPFGKSVDSPVPRRPLPVAGGGDHRGRDPELAAPEPPPAGGRPERNRDAPDPTPPPTPPPPARAMFTPPVMLPGAIAGAPSASAQPPPAATPAPPPPPPPPPAPAPVPPQHEVPPPEVPPAPEAPPQ